MTLLNGCFVKNKSTGDTTWALLCLAHHCSDNAKNPTLFLARMLLNDKLTHSFRFCSSSACPHSPLLWSLCAFWHRCHSRGCCSHHLTSRGGTSASLNCYLSAVLPDRSPRSPGHCCEQENRLWLRFAESSDSRIIKSSQNPPGPRPGANAVCETTGNHEPRAQIPVRVTSSPMPQRSPASAGPDLPLYVPSNTA